MELDEEVDVFHASKMVRLSRPQLIDNKVHTYRKAKCLTVRQLK